jgi:hypothetical protein
MKMEEMKDEEMYVLVAPDGTPQVSTLAPDYAMCLAMIRMFALSGMGASLEKLFGQGYHVLCVKITMTQVGDEHSAFDQSRKKLTT